MAESSARSISPSGDVLGVQDAPLGMAAFAAQVQFAHAGGRRHFALGKLHAQVDQFGDARRAFLHDRAHDVLLAKARAGLERVAHVHFDGVLLAGDGGDAALRVIGVGLRAVFFGDDGDPPARRDLQGKGQPRDAAAQDDEVVLFHARFRTVNHGGELWYCQTGSLVLPYWR